MSIALVTGAAGGLGSAICHILAEKGYGIIAMDLMSQHELEKKLADIKDDIKLFLGGVDFSNTQELQKKVASFLPNKEWTVLVNNAGVSVGGKFLDAKLEEWDLMMKVNLTAPFILSQLFAKNLQKNQTKGSIINISSMAGIVGAKKPGYAASKSGLLGLTKSIAMQVGPKIRCNAIYPGAINTPMTADWNKETREKISKNTFIGRIAEPEEIAQIVAFLADENQSGYLTGAVINATGGQYLGQ